MSEPKVKTAEDPRVVRGARMLEYALTRVLVLADREYSRTMLDNLLRDLPASTLQRIRDAAAITVQYADTVITQRRAQGREEV